MCFIYNIELFMMKFFKKNRALIVVFILGVFFTSFYAGIVRQVSSKSNGIVIVLDAGHGGRDGGSVGVNGTIESEINLEYVCLLKDKLADLGYKVILTRKNDQGLYDSFAQNKKLSDMNTRMEIIKNNNPNLVISLHMNSFNDKSVKGANTFYKVDDEASKKCADLVQKSLYVNCGARNEQAKTGDYFMLNCSYYTSILIECGFLSNPDEEKLLNSVEYKDRFTDAICKGVLLYFGETVI